MNIILNMIVKNEGPRIRRCLESAKPLIGGYVIVDTGSTDDTKAVIAEVMAGVPGRVVDEPWADYATARTQAIQHAQDWIDSRCGNGDDFLLFLDADDFLGGDVAAPSGSVDCYDLRIDYGPISYYRPALVRASLPWTYRGVLHEFLVVPPEAKTRGRLEAPRIIIGGKPETGTQEKYVEHARILEKALDVETDPFMQQRYTFYLAQSYRDAGQDLNAAVQYKIRAGMGGWDEEVYIAHLECGRANKRRFGAERALPLFLDAWNHRPSRLEAVGEAIVLCRETSQWHLGYALANYAARLMAPRDALFVEGAWSTWKLWDELGIAAYWTGDYEESEIACVYALRACPSEHQVRIEANLQFAREKMK